MWGLFGFFAFFCPHIKTNLGNYKLQSESYWFLILCSKVLKIDWLMGIIWKGTSGGYLPRELYFLYWERWYLSTQERKDSVIQPEIFQTICLQNHYMVGRKHKADKCTQILGGLRSACFSGWQIQWTSLSTYPRGRGEQTRARDQWDLEKGCTLATKMSWGTCQGDRNVDLKGHAKAMGCLYQEADIGNKEEVFWEAG